MKKKFITLLMVLSLCTGLAGCKSASTTNTDSTASTSSTVSTDAQILSSINVSSGESESVGEADTSIELGSTITVNGSGATVDKNKVTITSAGTYSIKGALTDGQIIVNAGDADKVYIILNGVNITCSDSAPIYVMSSDKTVISLADNTQNTVTSAADAATGEDEPDAAIFSKDDLVFVGKGSLNVESKNNDGIVSKDDLKIQDGNISVKAAGNGIKGKDTLVIVDGNITVNAEEDGIKSTNDTDAEKGYVLIEGGKIIITAGQDGIQGEISTLIKAGDLTINTGGGSKNSTANTNTNQMEPGNSSQNTSSEENASAKGVKAGVNIVIEGGTFNIDSSDDAIHSNNNLVISGGTFNISAGDDGLHTDSTLTINNGTVDVKKSNEGIEGKSITFKDGDINVVSSDDGINASAGSDTSSTNGHQGQGDDGSVMNINGGNITVNAGGDGVDSNGSIKMTGGTVIVNGPTDNGNAALDYNGTFDLTGGTFVAAGSSGMAQAPSSSSTQNSVKINLANQSAGTIVHIESSDGNEVITFAPSKSYSSIVVSSSKLEKGKTYKVYVGGSSTSTPTDGVYADGTYTKGTEAGSFTISGSVTEMTQDGVITTNNMNGQRRK